ncbi:hypothetical protein [Yinghuangia sp. YIM S09857]|uniref:hypothetical protein n=1 Tax=Yinghuangia sp. YIM S09857 TaxID=3436929 RepID=UPI003F5397D6
MTPGTSDLRDFPAGEVRVVLRELRFWDDVEGMLEGTPYLHRKFRLMQLERQVAETNGVYVHGLDGMRADMAAHVDSWLPRVRCHARLTSMWRPESAAGFGESELLVVWFQYPAEDPFTRLAEIVRPLDWTKLAVFKVHED